MGGRQGEPAAPPRLRRGQTVTVSIERAGAAAYVEEPFTAGDRQSIDDDIDAYRYPGTYRRQGDLMALHPSAGADFVSGRTLTRPNNRGGDTSNRGRVFFYWKIGGPEREQRAPI